MRTAFRKFIKRLQSEREFRRTRKFLQAKAQCPLSFSLVCNRVLTTPKPDRPLNGLRLSA